MAEQLPWFQPSSDFVNVENSDHIYFKKEIKKRVPRVFFSCKGTREFLKTLEKCKKHSPSAHSFLNLSRVLNNSRVLIQLNNALGASFISLLNVGKMRAL